MDSLLDRLEEAWTRGMFGQLIRFGIAGGISTLVYAAVYLPLSAYIFLHGSAVLAVPFAFAAALTCGFFLHSYWSFRGHGSRETSGRQHLKFVLAQSVGLLLNTLFTWTITGLLHQSNWVPLIPIMLFTPLATFVLNRQWVFA